MTQHRDDEKYTDPELRHRIKEDIKQSDKGGKSGQWSARKSQRLVQEYEKQGGGYQQDQKDEAARSLEAWSKQDKPSKQELYEQAKDLDIAGRNKMSRDQLRAAIQKATKS
jgi:hypothetical protein